MRAFALLPVRVVLIEIDFVLGFFFGGRFDQRPHDAKTDKQRIGIVPDALRNLRILLLPIFVAAAADGAAQTLGIVVP